MTEGDARISMAKSRQWLLPTLVGAASAIVALMILAAAIMYSGSYDVAADDPHSDAVAGLLATTRERSIATHASSVEVPSDLTSAERIATGAGLYAEMCSQCHLGPGVAPTEISQGLYPKAPHLAAGGNRDKREEFWAIKHGIKFSAMPAWGATHSDELIWDMVAFLQQMPGMSAEQYSASVAAAPAEHDEIMAGDGADHAHGAHGHHHEANESH